MYVRTNLPASPATSSPVARRAEEPALAHERLDPRIASTECAISIRRIDRVPHREDEPTQPLRESLRGLLEMVLVGMRGGLGQVHTLGLAAGLGDGSFVANAGGCEKLGSFCKTGFLAWAAGSEAGGSGVGSGSGLGSFCKTGGADCGSGAGGATTSSETASLAVAAPFPGEEEC